MSTDSNFYHNKSVFGFDIGQSTLKVMQCDPNHAKPRVVGYGYTEFEPSAIKDGVVVDPEAIAKATLNLFQHRLIGDITTKRTAMAIPSYRSYSRSLQLPKLKPSELEDAIRLEVEQYTPMSIDDLYIDYTLTSSGKTDEDLDEYMAVAIPKKIVESYMDLTRILGLEVVLIETTINAATRLFSRDAHSDVASVIIDFGTLSCDISIFRGAVLVTGTVPSGGLVFTRSIAQKLGVTEAEAATIKTRYGLAASKKQAEIIAAISPTLAQLAKEIRRMIRYYEERYGTDHPIGQIIALGGGANMPGLTDHLISELRIPVRTCDPWSYLNAHNMQLPALADHPMYATAAGLSFLKPNEVFRP